MVLDEFLKAFSRGEQSPTLKALDTALNRTINFPGRSIYDVIVATFITLLSLFPPFRLLQAIALAFAFYLDFVMRSLGSPASGLLEYMSFLRPWDAQKLFFSFPSLLNHFLLEILKTTFFSPLSSSSFSLACEPWLFPLTHYLQKLFSTFTFEFNTSVSLLFKLWCLVFLSLSRSSNLVCQWMALDTLHEEWKVFYFSLYAQLWRASE